MEQINHSKLFREWMDDWPECLLLASDIPAQASQVHFRREKNSHKGIAKHTKIKKLIAKQVDQDFLNEIGSLVNMERLEMEIVTASDLSPLKRLTNLRFLKIDSASKVTDFTPLVEIPSLKKLFLENSKHLENLDFLGSAHTLTVIGVEGSMYKNQKIPTLRPLSDLTSLEALFMSSVQLEDKSLDYLFSIPNLKYLSSARFAPKSSFTSLRHLMPNLICNWCDVYEIKLL